jgi:phosphoglycerate dehydrogenase-like enzyme
VAKAIYLMKEDMYELIYPANVRNQIETLIGSPVPHLTEESLPDKLMLLQETEIIFSGWGGVVMDEEFLKAAPKLKAVFYGSGSIKHIVSEAFWERNIRITSSYAANAIAVADYTLSQILFALKGGWHLSRMMKGEQAFPQDRNMLGEISGIYDSTVGIISLGMIGRYVCERLKSFDLNVIAYDPYASKEEAAKLNVELCTLEEVFHRADVVSLHTPWLKETEGLITGEHIHSMKKWASFINTSRGAIVREPEMVEVLRQRSDLQAVLDVTFPEPPLPGSLLYSLPNVILTPHISGASSKKDIARMGSFAAEELRLYLNGEPLKWEITREKAQIMA